eukprot:GEMP01014795.1.p1 GENE.GEMP01014795.1~~GEMP01014795.1.p1  ORF type:complete len:533 (+),score=100.38 GEMP01014795.1:92-1690(+)
MPFGCVGRRGSRRGSRKKDLVPSGESSSTTTDASPVQRDATFPVPSVGVVSPVNVLRPITTNDASSANKEVEVSAPPPVITASKTEEVVIPPVFTDPLTENEVTAPIVPLAMIESVTPPVIKDEDTVPTPIAQPRIAIVLQEFSAPEKSEVPAESVNVEDVQISETMPVGQAAEELVPVCDLASPDAATCGDQDADDANDDDNAVEIDDTLLFQFPMPFLDLSAVSLRQLNLKPPDVFSTVMPFRLTGLEAPNMLTLPPPFLPVMDGDGGHHTTSVAKPNWNMSPPMLTLPTPTLPKLIEIDGENGPGQATSLVMPNLNIPAPVLNLPISTVMTSIGMDGEAAPRHLSSLTMPNLDIPIVVPSEPGPLSGGLSPPSLPTVKIVNDDIDKSPLPPLQMPSLPMVSTTMPRFPSTRGLLFNYDDDDYDYLPDVRTLCPPMLDLDPKPVVAVAPRGISMRMPNLYLPKADMTPRMISCASPRLDGVQRFFSSPVDIFVKPNLNTSPRLDYCSPRPVFRSISSTLMPPAGLPIPQF